MSYLSITHMLSAQLKADFDISEAGHSTPHDRVPGRWISRTREVATETRQTNQIRRQGAVLVLTAVVGNKLIQQLDFQLRKCYPGRRVRRCAVHHCQPEDAPAQDAEHRDQIDQPLGGAELRVFGLTAGLQY